MNAPMPPTFAARVPGDYASWCERLFFGAPAVGDADVALPAARLGDHVEALLDGVRPLYDGDDARALLSQWSKYYFNLVVPPALVAARVLNRPLAMALSESTVVLRHGLPHALWLPYDALGDACDAPAPRYRSLCVEHLAPLIAQLSRAARLAPRVFWGNAANTLEYALVHELPGGAGDADWLLGRREFFDTGEANPLFRAIRYVDTERAGLASPFRARRVCCLRDRLPGETLLCSACPLLLSMSDAALAEQLTLREEE